jgi:uncharacterized protein
MNGRTNGTTMTTKTIAVIGAGISGLGAAWLLAKQHDVTLFERDRRAGGHANTVTVTPPGTPGGCSVAVDTGFIVYNTQCYPNLIGLFNALSVSTAPSSMTFSVSLDDGAYEYAGSAAGLFGQVANLKSADHWRMIADILKFFRAANALQSLAALAGAGQRELSLGDWLRQHQFSRAFIQRHIVPMTAAIWSVPPAQTLGFPAASFARFFANHGLLQVRNRPQWRTVEGGSTAYVHRLLAATPCRVVLGDAVTQIRRPRDGGVIVRTAAGHSQHFDRCLIACHADDALALLDDADPAERELLGAFKYEANTAILHTQAAFMPTRRQLWASWNYLGRSNAEGSATDAVSVTYWMNKLQPLSTQQNLFVTLNPLQPVAERAVLGQYRYHHPVFDLPAIQAQRQLWRIQGARGTWFAGAWAAFGFHEDGLQSGLAAAEDLVRDWGGTRRPWPVPEGQNRIVNRPLDQTAQQPATAIL